MENPNLNGPRAPVEPMQAKSFAKQMEEVKAANMPAPEILHRQETEAPDPLDIASMALSQDYLEKAGTTKLLTTIPIGKPKNQTFVRVNPDPAFRKVYGIQTIQEEGKIGKDHYLVAPGMLPVLSGEFHPATLYVGVTKQGNLFVWPIRLPEEGGRANNWARTEMLAAEKAMTAWIRIVANQSAGFNDILVSSSDLGEPKWPDLSYEEILRTAFRAEGIISSIEHPVVKQLRGEI